MKLPRSGFRVVFFGSLCVVASLASLYLWNLGPSLTTNTDSWDAGRVVQGQKLEHKFSLANTGTRALNIQAIESGCHCTTVLLADPQIRPKAVVELAVILDTKVLTGPVRKDILVYTDDPRQRVTRLSIRAAIEPEFNPSQRVIRFDRSEAEQRKSMDIVLSQDTTATLLDAHSNLPGVSVSLLPDLDQTPRSFRVVIDRQGGSSGGG